VDDLLDYTGNAETLGKPAAADLNLGLATAPVLFAMEEHKELELLVARKFNATGDVQRAQELVSKSRGIERTKELAEMFCNKAIEAVMKLKPSVARDALIEVAVMVVKRQK
jgi:geranylgeranyl pyrophosphate synthase